jgi:hypothetical protein
MSPAPAGDMSRPVDQRWNSEFSEGRRSDPRSPPRQLPSIPLPSAVDTQKYSNVQPQRVSCIAFIVRDTAVLGNYH